MAERIDAANTAILAAEKSVALGNACPAMKSDIVKPMVQRNADFGPYMRAGDDGSNIESMTVERKITSRYGVDSRPLSE